MDLGILPFNGIVMELVSTVFHLLLARKITLVKMINLLLAISRY